LKTASAIAGLLAGIAVLVYILGGLVLALRLQAAGFSFNAVAVTVGQLPRELVIANVMLHVLLPAALVGLVLGILAAFLAWVRRGISLPSAQRRPGFVAVVAILLITVVLFIPAILHSTTAGEKVSPIAFVIAGLFTLCAVYAAWHLLRRIEDGDWSPAGKLCVAGAVCAAVAVAPAALFGASLSFEPAKVCISERPLPEEGALIGEAGGRVLLADEFSREASIVSLPSDQVVKTEYGDLSSSFACPAAPDSEEAAKAAGTELGGHGSEREQQLAMELRPRVRFDSGEAWRPIAVEAFLGERFEDGGHGACEKGASPPCPDLAAVGQIARRKDAPAFIDIHGEARNGADFGSPSEGCLRSPPARDCNSGPGAAIYYRRTSHEGRWYWDYWWFFRYNDYTGRINRCVVVCGDHEGDWEGITVITTASTEPEILGAIYAAHKDRILVEASTLPTAGGHPLVWVARGTHASYPFDCDRGCKQYATIGGARLPEDPHDGAAPWGGNRDTECEHNGCVRPLPEAGSPAEGALPLAGGWAGWPGKWGATCHDDCPGPRHREGSPSSPGGQIRFQCPWVPTVKAQPAADGNGLTASTRVGDRERLYASCVAQRGGR
jgi:hypothetical protein